MSRRPDPWRGLALRALYRAGWSAGARVPEPVVRSALAAGSRLAVRRGGVHVAHLSRNLAAVTGAPPSPDLLQAAVASHLRNVYETLALPGWSSAQVLARVSTTGEPALRAALAERGAVLALPHSGNWDLAGAWACATGMGVSTVAEQLADPDFAAFSRFRRRLGMEVWSHRDPALMTRLADAVRRRRLLCLLADRDLSGRGVTVRWGAHLVTMPAGPALLARRTGAFLVPVVSRFTPDGMHLMIGTPLEPVPGPGGVPQMTQAVAAVFAREIAQQPEDWHLLQPFFGAES